MNLGSIKAGIERFVPGGTKSLRKVLPRRVTFWLIYRMNHWGSDESVSGPGSTLQATAELRTELPRILSDYSMGSMLDAACGDFHWMSEVDLPCSYIGAEIVGDLARQLESEYGSSERAFIHRDICRGPFPEVDLIFCREVTIHLPLLDVRRALDVFRQSGSKYLLITHHTEVSANLDIAVGGWRAINFMRPPFSFPAPLEVVPDIGVDSPDKTMALWRLDDLPMKV